MRRAVVVVLLAGGLAAGCGRAGDGGRARCLAARDAGKWPTAVEVCRGPLADYAKLGLAWAAFNAGDSAGALAMLPPLYDGAAGPDAKYLAGYLIGRGQDGDHDRARPLFQQALAGFQAAGRHDAATRAADYLSRVPRPEALFDDALAMARLAVEEAYLSKRDDIIGRAETALAEVYDDIGMADEARAAFLRAEAHFGPWPDKLAYTYLKHGRFLANLGTADDFHAALSFFDAAQGQVERAKRDGIKWSELAVVNESIPTNRAIVYAYLDDVTTARMLFDSARRGREPTREMTMLRGYIAARAGDLDDAEKLIAQATGSFDTFDYQWQATYELARAYDRAGRLTDAIRNYRRSIGAIEEIRTRAVHAELRPWVLARRTAPYTGLIDLLARQGSGREALFFAEALHARTWLDRIVFHEGKASFNQRLQRARLNQYVPSEPFTAEAPLLARLQGHEALVYVTDGDSAWRFHARQGDVTVARLTAAQLAAVAGFTANVDDGAASEAAARVLLPEGISTRGEPLYVVAEGALAGVPFAALRVDGRYLIEARPVARVPGLAVLGCRPRAWTSARVFLGDAAGDLPRAAEEVRRLGGRAALVGAAATRAALASSRDAALLHAAVHGRVTAAGGALELADGTLTAAEILEEQIAPREVILTGCATAAAWDAEAWGGFPSAFLAAGSQNVVATLRSVADADAATMAAAYDAEDVGLGPVARLAAAQRQLAAMHPASTWAFFSVWGDAACASAR